jgi:hypothetical protein
VHHSYPPAQHPDGVAQANPVQRAKVSVQYEYRGHGFTSSHSRKSRPVQESRWAASRRRGCAYVCRRPVSHNIAVVSLICLRLVPKVSVPALPGNAFSARTRLCQESDARSWNVDVNDMARDEQD